MVRPGHQTPTLIIARTSSSLFISIWRVSKNLRNVDIVITCVLDVSIPAQFDIILAEAIPSNTFFWAHSASVNSVSNELFLVKRPAQIHVQMQGRRNTQEKKNVKNGK